MIERYFFKGARFKWTAPASIANGSRDGSIVVNPATPPGSMTYVGTDDQLLDAGQRKAIDGMFPANTVLTYSWLNYVLGHTAKLSSSADVLTGFMSGCLITTWSDETGRWVGHVGTVESAGKHDPPNSDVKLEFQNFMPENVRGYNPAASWALDEVLALLNKVTGRPSAKVLSLVTPTSDFYSAIMLVRQDLPGIWTCGGLKLVAGMGHQGLFNELAVPMRRMETFIK